MRYIKKFISTLATMNYYSSSDSLDDHLSSMYLQQIFESGKTDNQEECEEDETYAANLIYGELSADRVCAQMNNSYSSR